MRASRSRHARPRRAGSSARPPRARRSTPGVDRRVGADVGVGDAGAGADDRGPAHDRALELRARLRRPRGPRPSSRSSSPSTERSMSSRTSRFASSMSSSWPVSFHQPVTVWLSTALAVVDQPLDRVGDLELAAPRRLDRLRGVEDLRAEHVDADQRQVGRRVLRLLDQPHDLARRRARRRRSARGPERGSSRIRASGSDSRKASTRSVMPSRRRLSPRYMTNGPSWRKSSAVSTAWARPSGRVLVDVGDRGAELRAVAGGGRDLVARLGGDDDPDLLDPGLDQRLDSVEEHRLVRHRHELLRGGMGDRAQARARAAREDQTLEALHRPREG